MNGLSSHQCYAALFPREAPHLSILANDEELPTRRRHAVEDGKRVELILGQYLATLGGDSLEKGAALAVKGGGKFG